jgi:DNA-binding phage protein
MKTPRHVSHGEVVVGMVKADPQMADVYLANALEENNLPSGQFALLAAQRHITKAQGSQSKLTATE